MIDLEVDGGIATIVLHRPPVNAIDLVMVHELEESLDRVEADRVARVLVVRAAEPKVFSAGADIAMLGQGVASETGIEELIGFCEALQGFLSRLEHSSLPSIALIQGVAVGGGLELALACDLRVMATNARVGLTESTLGLVPAGGGTQRLAAIAGSATARMLILGGKLVDGVEAKALGIVQYVFPEEEFMRRSMELAHELSERPAAALAEIKACISLAPSPAGYLREITASRRLYAEAETRSLLTQFLSRRERKD